MIVKDDRSVIKRCLQWVKKLQYILNMISRQFVDLLAWLLNDKNLGKQTYYTFYLLITEQQSILPRRNTRLFTNELFQLLYELENSSMFLYMVLNYSK